ncbi:MAG TPA: zf-TFIIB domain-containing protein [Anaeromyxobacteraceae bacterium]|nr:zf-TFIIB domain-containing protein [Anaeromyxobacteraceae bacterium]
MDCPRCSVELSAITHDESSINRCSECGGLWVDGTDLTKILLHANLPALTAIGGSINVEEIAGQCPACNVDLVVVEGGEKRALHYDTCESCGGIWVEGEDVDEVPASIEWKDASAELAGFFRSFAKKK